MAALDPSCRCPPVNDPGPVGGWYVTSNTEFLAVLYDAEKIREPADQQGLPLELEDNVPRAPALTFPARQPNERVRILSKRADDVTRGCRSHHSNILTGGFQQPERVLR
jgi:hypothetical protein